MVIAIRSLFIVAIPKSEFLSCFSLVYPCRLNIYEITFYYEDVEKMDSLIYVNETYATYMYCHLH